MTGDRLATRRRGQRKTSNDMCYFSDIGGLYWQFEPRSEAVRSLSMRRHRGHDSLSQSVMSTGHYVGLYLPNHCWAISSLDP